MEATRLRLFCMKNLERRQKPMAELRDNPLLVAWMRHVQSKSPWQIPSFQSFRWRERLIKRFAWAVPTPEALTVIAKYTPIVEIGAGTGYWALLLQRNKVDIIAYDKHLPGPNHPFHHRHGFISIYQGGPSKLQYHTNRTLLLCWPPYATEMATQCLTAYKGKHIIYVGEEEGGCNATDKFFDRLETGWTIVERIDLPQFPGIHDYLIVYKRK